MSRPSPECSALPSPRRAAAELRLRRVQVGQMLAGASSNPGLFEASTSQGKAWRASLGLWSQTSWKFYHSVSQCPLSVGKL